MEKLITRTQSMLSAPAIGGSHHYHHYRVWRTNRICLLAFLLFCSIVCIMEANAFIAPLNSCATTTSTRGTPLLLKNSKRDHDSGTKGISLGRIRVMNSTTRKVLFQNSTLTSKPTGKRNTFVSTVFTLPFLALTGFLWSITSGASHAASSLAVGSQAAASSLGVACYSSSKMPTWYMATIAILMMAQSIGGIAWKLSVVAFQLFGKWYMTQLAANPIVIKSITAGVIGVVGDYMAQWLEHWLEHGWTSGSRNNKRTTADSAASTSYLGKTASTATRISPMHRLSIFGAYDSRRGLSIWMDSVLISGPLMHVGYELFERFIPISTGSGSSSLMAAVSHVVADSILLDSVFVASTFIVTGLMEGYTHKQLIPQMKQDYIPTLKASWATSISLLPVEIACFRYLPLSLRVLAVNLIDVVWDAVISFMAHRSRKQLHAHQHKLHSLSTASSEHEEITTAATATATAADNAPKPVLVY